MLKCCVWFVPLFLFTCCHGNINHLGFYWNDIVKEEEKKCLIYLMILLAASIYSLLFAYELFIYYHRSALNQLLLQDEWKKVSAEVLCWNNVTHGNIPFYSQRSHTSLWVVEIKMWWGRPTLFIHSHHSSWNPSYPHVMGQWSTGEKRGKENAGNIEFSISGIPTTATHAIKEALTVQTFKLKLIAYLFSLSCDEH